MDQNSFENDINNVTDAVEGCANPNSPNDVQVHSSRVNGTTRQDLLDMIAAACANLDSETQLVIYLTDHGDTDFDLDEFNAWLSEGNEPNDPNEPNAILVDPNEGGNLIFPLHDGWEGALAYAEAQPDSNATPYLDITVRRWLFDVEWDIVLNDVNVVLPVSLAPNTPMKLYLDYTSIKNGSNTLSFVPTSPNEPLLIANLDLSSGPIPMRRGLVPPYVVRRSVFHNNSAFDGPGADPNLDDNAIDTSKSALRLGETATFANVVTNVKGINGIMVDILDLPGTPNAADFQFRVGNDNQPWLWPLAPPPESITVRSGAGACGSDRVTLTFADTDLYNSNWLEVQVGATANTGLSAPDVFYFGLAVGESTGSPDFQVDANDRFGTRSNPHDFLNPAPVDDAYDFNRDKDVDANDRYIQRQHGTDFLNDLEVITPLL